MGNFHTSTLFSVTCPKRLPSFPALKLHLGGKHFANDDELQAEANHWLRRQDTAWYSSDVKKLLQRYQKCLDRNELSQSIGGGVFLVVVHVVQAMIIMQFDFALTNARAPRGSGCVMGSPHWDSKETEAGLDGNSKKVEVDHGRRQSDHGRHGCPTSRIGIGFGCYSLTLARHRGGYLKLAEFLLKMILGKDAQNVQKITDLIKENPRTTLLELEQDTSISKTTIGRIVTKDLKLKKTPAKFIPRFLTNEQKLCRLATCENMLEMTRTNPEWKDKIITGDETWVYDYDPETKRQYAEWRGQVHGGPGLQAFRPISLPTTDYRVLSGVLMARLRRHLPDLVPQCQTYAVSSGWIAVLYGEAAASIQVGDIYTKAFPLLNGVRQGCRLTVLGCTITTRNTVASQASHLMGLLERAIASLVLGSILHHLHGYLPPETTIGRLQARLMRFVWGTSRVSWLPGRILAHLVSDGGVGLLDIAGQLRFACLKGVQASLRGATKGYSWLEEETAEPLGGRLKYSCGRQTCCSRALATGDCRGLLRWRPCTNALNALQLSCRYVAESIVLRGSATLISRLTSQRARRALDSARLQAHPTAELAARWTSTLDVPRSIPWADLRRNCFSGHDADVALRLTLHALPHPDHPATRRATCAACGFSDGSLTHRYWSCRALRPLLRKGFASCEKPLDLRAWLLASASIPRQ
ncbi:hypothetical protein LAZ67_11001596 [Cordylochernes scorpioides]|uniref:Uncharacterized protein n=1 Tax=Cordylochernes scorpioides TaxID=51811 RepID=A0ABY6KZA2_9ARAC|nr:hypothetical protein LAZ67_11001596 [Cordylochernes scorpioides]